VFRKSLIVHDFMINWLHNLALQQTHTRYKVTPNILDLIS